MLGRLSSTSLLVVGSFLLTRSSLVHLAFDAALLSAFLSGVRRTTGLSYAHSSICARVLILSPGQLSLKSPARIYAVSFPLTAFLLG